MKLVSALFSVRYQGCRYQLVQDDFFNNMPIPEDPLLLPFPEFNTSSLPKEGDAMMQKRIHQIFMSEQIPIVYESTIKSWMVHHPDWEYRLWTPQRLEELLQVKYPHFVDTINLYVLDSQRASLLRFLVLLEFGGLFLELNMHSLRSLNPLTYQSSCFLVMEPYETSVSDATFFGMFSDHFIGCRAHHPYLKALLVKLQYLRYFESFDRPIAYYMHFVYTMYAGAHVTFSPTHPNYVLLMTPYPVFPFSDPTRHEALYRTCADNYVYLSPSHKRVCQHLKRQKPLQQRLASAFALRQPCPLLSVNRLWAVPSMHIRAIVPKINMTFRIRGSNDYI
ncbi:hypothetical protein C0Q70_19756 [Pomacea canaliculata]|uniref:Nucleotide-diphospho-sugar transferase domain-containing protein n=1 Tax=Pomacea canaliculata TaxID=400727 RepID=A0A2T7NDL7_POMCA|nr:hypothetical protein C0Q70_19756 [Pomacea canaliculata]